MPQTRIGISGWRYGPWRGTFYPKDLPQRCELEFASRNFNSIEINGSFYSLQHVPSWECWHDVTPDKVSACEVITGSDLKAVNTFDAPKKVVPQSLEPPKVGAKMTLQLPARSYTLLSVTV